MPGKATKIECIYWQGRADVGKGQAFLTALVNQQLAGSGLALFGGGFATTCQCMIHQMREAQLLGQQQHQHEQQMNQGAACFHGELYHGNEQ
ncbi:MAG: hypothetical protein RL748_4387 [Pseudomonadota bacterium]